MPNLSKTGLNGINIGDVLKFTVKDYNDNVEYTGTVVAICDYQTARSFEDVVARHQSILATLTGMEMDDDIAHYRFLIVECYDGVRRPFAFNPINGESWFSNDEVDVIEPTQEFVLTITGVNRTQAGIALRILKEHGYSCSLSAK